MLLWARKNGCPCDENELHIAAQNGHEAMVRALIEAGAGVNKARDDGATPLLIAAQRGHEAVVRALIEADADVSKARADGVMPLYMAAQKGHTAIVQILRD
jgi:ankyrin repeat protein